MPRNDLLGTAEAARELGIGQQRVRDLINAGRLPAQKLGHDYVIRRSDLAKVRVRTHGRPPKKRK